MATFQIIAGDFGQHKEGSVTFGKYYRADAQGLNMPHIDGGSRDVHYGLGQIQSLEIATEQSLKKMSGAIGWGFAGAVALGPIGAIAGLLAGGRRDEVTFVCQFKDGRKFLGRCDTKTYTSIQAASFTPAPPIAMRAVDTREPTEAEKRLGYIVGGVIMLLIIIGVLLTR
jgi:hypothetical protein